MLLNRCEGTRVQQAFSLKVHPDCCVVINVHYEVTVVIGRFATTRLYCRTLYWRWNWLGQNPLAYRKFMKCGSEVRDSRLLEKLHVYRVRSSSDFFLGNTPFPKLDLFLSSGKWWRRLPCLVHQKELTSITGLFISHHFTWWYKLFQFVKRCVFFLELWTKSKIVVFQVQYRQNHLELIRILQILAQN
jgi:hypothetical protein